MKKHIIVITTGGTIAMKKDPETGGLVPAVSGEDLAAAVPRLSDWRRFRRRILQRAERLDERRENVRPLSSDRQTI